MAFPADQLARVREKLRGTPLTFSLYIQSLIGKDLRDKIIRPRHRPKDTPPSNSSREE